MALGGLGVAWSKVRRTVRALSRHGPHRHSRGAIVVVCWETWAHRSGDHHPHHLVSYDTMTACARGCEVSQIGGVWWVSAIRNDSVVRAGH
jgi:hypothetical protein